MKLANGVYRLAIGYVAVPALLLPTRSRYLTLAQSIRKRQFWSTSKISEYQLDQLQKLVARASEVSAYYRDLFRRNATIEFPLKSIEDIVRLPVTTKLDIETNFPDRMVDLSKRTSDWQMAGTRGTTRRVVVFHDFAKRDAERACELVVTTEDCQYHLGDSQVAIPPDACSTHCGIEGQRADRIRDQLWALATGRKKANRDSISDLRGIVMDRWIRRYTSLPPMDPAATDEQIAEYVAKLHEIAPVALMALPEYLRMFVRYAEQSGKALPRIPIVRPMGANLPQSWKPSIASAFGGDVRETYGSRELGPMAFDCHLQCGLHVLSDQYYLEVVDAMGYPVPDGEVGQVLVTDLQNWTMPMLRYKIGDMARVYREPCRCGRQSMRIQLEGRSEDAIPDRNGHPVTAETVANLLFTRFAVDRFQLIEQSPGKLQLRYVPGPTYSATEAEIGNMIEKTLGLSGPIRVRQATLIRPEGSGKFRHCQRYSPM